MIAALSPREGERLRALRRHGILDTSPEAVFDRITSLAAKTLHVRFALVTLVDHDRQWFKSCFGTELRSTDLSISFCSHAILSEAPTVVGDLTQDPRFADNPMVTGDPHLRFYAGVPLKVAGGFHLGTLCVLDLEPREFTGEQEEILNDFALMVMSEMRARLAIREGAQQATAIASLSSGVTITDITQKDNPVVFCNPGFTTMTGYGAEEVIGRNCRFLQGAGSDPATIDEIRRAIAEKRGFHGLLKNFRKNGELFWNELTLCPVVEEDGRVVHFVGLQNDATERKQAEDALAESFERLRKAEALRTDLTNMIVHDLRSPLSAILMGLEVLKSSGTRTAAGDIAIIDFLLGSTGSLAGMVTQLLDVSRMEAGEMPLKMEDTDLRELAQAAAKLLEPLRERRAIEITGAAVHVSCDGAVIQRVIGNLLGNALKFTRDDGKITVNVEQTGSGAVISVTDDGPGIAPEFHEDIFSRFGQLVTGSERKGTGLGLTFCRLAVEAHRGRINLRSDVGKGSTFGFELPGSG